MPRTDFDTVIEEKTKNEIKRPKMWNVILHNDDYTPMDFVVLILMQIFHKSFAESNAIMMNVHEQGKSIVGTYTHEVAAHKQNDVRYGAAARGYPLLCTIEETTD